MPEAIGGISLISGQNSRRVAIARAEAVTLFESIAVLQADSTARRLGLFGSVVMGRDLRARFATFKVPKHLLSNRKNGCAWNPKGGVRLRVDDFQTCPVEYDGEQCPDAFYGTCFETLFGPGNGVRNIAGTEEGRQVLLQLLNAINVGLGNSFWELYNFANHPLIADADAASSYAVSIDEWMDYKDQQMSGECGGLITQLDELKAISAKGFTESVPVDGSGNFNGTFSALFEAVKESASPELQIACDNGINIGGRIVKPIVLATSQVFKAYKNSIKALAGTNELAYRFSLMGMDGVTRLEPDVLMIDGLPVVNWDSCTQFDGIVGTKSHRLAIVVPGNFGVLHDVDNLAMYDGMGMLVEQSTQLKDKGKVFMSTTFRWGAGIADTNLVAMGSNILHS